MLRLWLLPRGPDSLILTGPQMGEQDIHPLRCVYLGRFTETGSPAALAAARAAVREPALVIAANVRAACDFGQTRRWRLTAQSISLLRAGEILHVRDRLGSFACAYDGPPGTPTP